MLWTLGTSALENTDTNRGLGFPMGEPMSQSLRLRNLNKAFWIHPFIFNVILPASATGNVTPSFELG